MLSKLFRRVAPAATRHLTIKAPVQSLFAFQTRSFGFRDDLGFDDEYNRVQTFTKNYSGIQQAKESELPMTRLEELPEQMQRRLMQNDITELFPVQASAYNLFVQGKELIVKSRTGTGKTLAFLLPLETLITTDRLSDPRGSKLQAIILEPTRELALQVAEQISKFSNLKAVTIYGGDPSRKAHHQMYEIKRTQPHILVATPGRLIDLCQNFQLDISSCKYQILDEGDKMLDMGFDRDIETLQQEMPAAQTMIFSATVPQYIQKIAKSKMKDPLLIDLVGQNENQVPDRIENIAVICSPSYQHKQNLVEQYVRNNRDKKILIFTDTKREADQFGDMKFAQFLPLHGDLSQDKRQRTLEKFKLGRYGEILVATDVAARGLDIDNIDTVIQLQCNHVDSFVHRSGRTGRAGKSGTNIVFSKKDDLGLLRNCEKNLKIKIKYVNNIGNEESEEQKQQQRDQNERFVSRIKSKAQREFTTSDEYINDIISFYEQSDETARKNMFQNVVAQLMIQRQAKTNAVQSVGLVTGNSGFKTFVVAANNYERKLAQTLQSMGVVFAKERGDIIMDLNAGDSRQIDKIEQLLADMDLKMEEVSEIPEIFKAQLITSRPPSMDYGRGGSRYGNDRGNGYSRGNSYGGQGRDRGRSSFLGGNNYESRDNNRYQRSDQRYSNPFERRERGEGSYNGGGNRYKKGEFNDRRSRSYGDQDDF